MEERSSSNEKKASHAAQTLYLMWVMHRIYLFFAYTFYVFPYLNEQVGMKWDIEEWQQLTAEVRVNPSSLN